MKLALVGATGLVGAEMIKVLEERRLPISQFIPVASNKSLHKTCQLYSQTYKIQSIEQAVALKPDVALFSAGSGISLAYAPKFAAVGTVVIDNSSAWRMDENIKLIVPEINAQELTKEDKIIANPNCSTIQMVMALAPLHQKYTIKRIVVSTYQSVTGSGKEAVQQLMNERQGRIGDMAYSYPIDLNIIPQIDVFLDNDYTKEEMKMVNETRKILGDQSINVTATCVRLPIIAGHSEAVNVEFADDFDVENVRKILANTSGVVVQDNPANFNYPMPKYAQNRDDVFVGRIRRDESQAKSLNMWIVSDNLRKGAATNTVQIAEYLYKNNYLTNIDS